MKTLKLSVIAALVLAVWIFIIAEVVMAATL